jgi:hypothetical protein
MARKRALKQFSEKDLLEEIARRHADKHFRDGMTMSEIELSVEALKAGAGEPSVALMLSRMNEYGFHPVDASSTCGRKELTSEMEKRVLDFAVNDVYGECAARWRLHYQEQISENLFRRVAARVGEQCESADVGRLQEALKPRTDAADVLVVEVVLPIQRKRAVEGGEGRRPVPLPVPAVSITRSGGCRSPVPLEGDRPGA